MIALASAEVPDVHPIVLEREVFERAWEYADAQGVSVSVVVNEILKEKLGITKEGVGG